MVEVTMLAGVELDLAAVVEAGGKAAVVMDCLDDGKVALSNAERFVGCRELDAVLRKTRGRSLGRC